MYFATRLIASVYGFFELIPCIYQDLEKLHDASSKISESFSDHISSIFKEDGFDTKDHNLLAQLAIFPAKYGQFSESYQSIRDEYMDDSEYDIGAEIDFYRFISKCRKLLDTHSPSIECCEVHGSVEGFEKVVNCQYGDGIAATLEKLTDRSAVDLFVKGGSYVV